MSTSDIATSAVVPRCPRCSLPVRGSVQLRADFADLSLRIWFAVTHFLRQETNAEQAAALVAIALAEQELGALDAELAGHHYVCPVH